MQPGVAQLFLSRAGVDHVVRWHDEIKGGRRSRLGNRVNVEHLEVGRNQTITHLNRNKQTTPR